MPAHVTPAARRVPPTVVSPDAVGGFFCPAGTRGARCFGLGYDFPGMAQIRIVDTWMRSPASPPTQYRSVMVCSEKWAEQRVLMRAYAESRDQTRPTIMLHGTELAIGPAGTDVNGPWGIHVGEIADARTQEIKAHFEHAAKRLAGSKGNPPLLADEENTFDREPTANWGPGAPRILPARTDVKLPQVDFMSPAEAARVPQIHQHVTFANPQAVQHRPPPAAGSAAPSNPELRKTPLPRRSNGKTRPPPNARTALGYTSMSGAQSAVVRLGLNPTVSSRLGRLVDRIVPPEFHVDHAERRVLNALGEAGSLTARAIGHMLDLVDAVTYMEELTRKLEMYGLDLVEPGDPVGTEPTYRLRR